jgi:hypothetical protein
MIAKDLALGTGIKPFAIMKGDRKYEVIGVPGAGVAFDATPVVCAIIVSSYPPKAGGNSTRSVDHGLPGASGLEASEHGDWLGAGYYNYMAAGSELNGNDFYAQAMAMGC